MKQNEIKLLGDYIQQAKGVVNSVIAQDRFSPLLNHSSANANRFTGAYRYLDAMLQTKPKVQELLRNVSPETIKAATKVERALTNERNNWGGVSSKTLLDLALKFNETLKAPNALWLSSKMQASRDAQARQSLEQMASMVDDDSHFPKPSEYPRM